MTSSYFLTNTPAFIQLHYSPRPESRKTRRFVPGGCWCPISQNPSSRYNGYSAKRILGALSGRMKRKATYGDGYGPEHYLKTRR